jgi:hypothetical protein
MESVSPGRERDRRMGILIVASAFAAALCISWWARSRSGGEPEYPPPPPTTEGLVGYPHQVDVLASLAGARKLTERDQLRGIAVWGAKSDGTVDVSSAGSRIRYSFASARGDGPQPPRPPGTLPKREYCGRQNVHVKSEGFVADPDQPATPCPVVRGDQLPEPRCGPKEVWQKALAKGAPADQRALIEYYRAEAGPAWHFTIPGTRFLFTLYGDCERELYGVDANGSVP